MRVRAESLGQGQRTRQPESAPKKGRAGGWVDAKDKRLRRVGASCPSPFCTFGLEPGNYMTEASISAPASHVGQELQDLGAPSTEG